MVTFLADECTFDPTEEFLRNEGWDVTTVKEIGLQAAKGPQVVNTAQEMGAVLITRDIPSSDSTGLWPGIFAIK